MKKIRILVAEDHALVLKATAAVLRLYPDFEVVGEAEGVQQALDMLRTLQPDILLCGIRLSQISTIEVIRQAKELAPKTRALVLAGYDEDEYFLGLFKAGVSGYLVETVDSDVLAESIRVIHLGQTVIHPALVAKMARMWAQEKFDGRLFEQLSARELGVSGWLPAV